jgi:hypothetical protein
MQLLSSSRDAIRSRHFDNADSHRQHKRKQPSSVTAPIHARCRTGIFPVLRSIQKSSSVLTFDSVCGSNAKSDLPQRMQYRNFKFRWWDYINTRIRNNDGDCDLWLSFSLDID